MNRHKQYDPMVKTLEYFSGTRPEMMNYVPVSAGTILEIGCGEGKFGLRLKEERGAKVWGVEYDPASAMKAEKVLDRVIAGDVTMALNELPDAYFDAVVCNDVLEHLTDPYTVLDRLKKKLSLNGVVVSSIPNVRFFRNLYDLVFRKNWDYTEDGILDKTHFRFFTKNSIRKMYEGAGYKILHLEGINASKSIRPIFWNLLFLGAFSDIKYRQFATVATPDTGTNS